MRMRTLAALAVATTVLFAGVVTAAGQSPATLNVGGNDELGSFVVAADGLTLYIFTPDPPGESACTGDCAANWPPLTVPEGQDPTTASGVPGTAGITIRDDGSRQVTLDEQPLYYFAADAAPGDANGQGVGDVWFVVALDAASPGGAAPVTPPAAGNAGLLGGPGAASTLVVAAALLVLAAAVGGARFATARRR